MEMGRAVAGGRRAAAAINYEQIRQAGVYPDQISLTQALKSGSKSGFESAGASGRQQPSRGGVDTFLG